METFKNKQEINKKDAEIVLAEVIDDIYLEMKEGFAGGHPHKLGMFKERVKHNFHKNLDGEK